MIDQFREQAIRDVAASSYPDRTDNCTYPVECSLRRINPDRLDLCTAYAVEQRTQVLTLQAKVEELERERGASTPHRNRDYSTNPLTDARLSQMCDETRWWKTDHDEIYRVVHELRDLRRKLSEQGELVGRLVEAMGKIIEMNRQHAKDEYGDADRAESWACVKVAREAMNGTTK